jgi:exodeoxyribonuclease V alpha subunit
MKRLYVLILCQDYIKMTGSREIQAITTLTGSIERITYHNPDNGFCVLKVKAQGHEELVVVVGNAHMVSPGEYIDCRGQWLNDRQFGQQFKAEELKIIPPSNVQGMEKYLASGIVKGIGPNTAKLLIETYGAEVFNIIEKCPEKLLELPGIGNKRLELITMGWDEQMRVREIMVFLQAHGMGTARAMRIYKTYGDQAILRVKENPYRLALDIPGIGFKTADELALQMGVARDSLLRAQAGVRHALQELSSQGHCISSKESLVKESMQLLEITAAQVETALNAEVKAGNLVVEEVPISAISMVAAEGNQSQQNPIENTLGDTGVIDEVDLNLDQDQRNTKATQTYYMLPILYQAECGVSMHFERLLAEKTRWHDIDVESSLPWVESRTGTALSASQRHAVITAIASKIAVITGGPGVGKTTIVKSILQLVRRRGASVALCAPTGRAAKRLGESTGLEAKTIHRLLEYDPGARQFKRETANPLEADLVVVDEASMIDVVLMYHLVKAIPASAGLLLVGDVDQLPSVGPGSVLADVINSHAVNVVRLTEIFRQAASSKIIVNSHRINQGELPLANTEGEDTDFYTIIADSPAEIHAKLLAVVTERIPKRFGFDPVRQIQVLTPMHRGDLGVRGLNQDLQARLNPNGEPRINRFGWTFACGDKVLQTVNNYEKEVFNGDIGYITMFKLEEQEVYIDFENRLIAYRFDELDELVLAYATTIHKSQGSEYPAVVIPLSLQHYTMLQRNLIYTAVTRGKQLVVLIGQQKAITLAVENYNANRRQTLLRQRLAELC